MRHLGNHIRILLSTVFEVHLSTLTWNPVFWFGMGCMLVTLSVPAIISGWTLLYCPAFSTLCYYLDSIKVSCSEESNVVCLKEKKNRTLYSLKIRLHGWLILLMTAVENKSWLACYRCCICWTNLFVWRKLSSNLSGVLYTNRIYKQMFVKHLPPARSEYRVPQRPITKTGTKEGQLTQRYY